MTTNSNSNRMCADIFVKPSFFLHIYVDTYIRQLTIYSQKYDAILSQNDYECYEINWKISQSLE